MFQSTVETQKISIYFNPWDGIRNGLRYHDPARARARVRVCVCMCVSEFDHHCTELTISPIRP